MSEEYKRVHYFDCIVNFVCPNLSETASECLFNPQRNHE